MKIGDLIIKKRGSNKGKLGIVTRIYNEDNDGHIIVEVLSDSNVYKWALSWVEIVEQSNQGDYNA